MGGSEPEPANVIEEKGKDNFFYDEDIDREVTPEVSPYLLPHYSS